MCLNDWRLGRFIKTHHHTQSFIAGGGATTIVTASQQRVGLLISCPGIQGTLNVGIVKSSGGINGVWCLTGFEESKLFTVTEFGDLLTHAWSGIDLDVDTDANITEFFLPQEWLNLDPKSLISSYQP